MKKIINEKKLHNIIVDVLNEMKAFHGTSARFNKFKSDYNLSGEGSESFGPGHYFTASKQIGKDYANEHGTSKVEIPRFKYSGCGGDAIYQSHQLFMDINKLVHLDKYDEEHNHYLWRNLYPLMCNCKTKGELIRTIYQYAIKAIKSKEDYEEDKFWYDLRLDDLLKLLKENIVETTRELYQVEIPDEDKYADWNDIVDDRMFDYASSLIDSTKDADRNFEQINKSLGYYLEKNQDITYDIFWKCLNNMNYDGSVGDNIFKLTLKRFGYVGVKYPSGQNFQTSSTKDGDMNYTVFDDDNVKITNRWDL